jgi:hypothetical protein
MADCYRNYNERMQEPHPAWMPMTCLGRRLAEGSVEIWQDPGTSLPTIEACRTATSQLRRAPNFVAARLAAKRCPKVALPPDAAAPSVLGTETRHKPLQNTQICESPKFRRVPPM